MAKTALARACGVEKRIVRDSGYLLGDGRVKRHFYGNNH